MLVQHLARPGDRRVARREFERHHEPRAVGRLESHPGVLRAARQEARHPGLAGAAVAAGAVVVVAEGHHVRDFPVELAERARRDLPLSVRVVVGDVTRMEDGADAEPVALAQDEVGLRLEEVRAIARVDLRVREDDEAEAHGRSLSYPRSSAMTDQRKRRRRGIRLGRGMRRLRMGFENAREIVRVGGLSTPHRTPYDVAHQERAYSVRRYQGVERSEGAAQNAPAILLVPPLMVTSEIYDMAPDVSAVSVLLGQGLDVWMVDFGAPERVEGGKSRTLDDHVLGVSRAIDFVREATGRDVHLAGYSQGGMFCYQAAAYRHSEGLASLITFGSPVDIHRAFPVPVSEEVAERILDGLHRLIERPLAELEALPGSLTSVGFKLVSPKKELAQLFDFVGKLHDRQALEKRESRRRFLGGEGFVSWPGPALRTFVDEFIVANRLTSGGFVIDGRTVSLADVTCPILAFVGLRDDIAKPAAVRAIERVAFNARVHVVPVKAGHLGLVVGSRALSVTWPTVSEWMRHLDDDGPPPRAFTDEAQAHQKLEDIDEIDEVELNLDLGDLFGAVTGGAERLFKRLTAAGEDLADTADSWRYQLPRLSRLRRIRSGTRISFGRELARQAEELPDHTFFLYKGRAFTYAEADRRVNAVVKGLIHCGIRPGQRVGVLMEQRPSYLSIVAAVNRLGAVSVLIGTDSTRATIERALALGEVEVLVTDPANAELARQAFRGSVLALGGPYGADRSLPQGVVDMEAIDPDAVPLPSGFEPDPLLARDLAMVLFTAGRAEEPRAAKITNRRWAFSALGAAAGCTLKPSDTVFCVLPLHHAAGVLVAVGGALVGGARLALASRFVPEHFWGEARRYGATVVFYAGEMCRALVDAPPDRSDAQNPVRLFAGSGMRIDVWEGLRTRFESGVLEFYATTEGNAVLANASGGKIGSLGRPLPGATDMALLQWDFDEDAFARGGGGRYRRAGIEEPGVLIARVDPGHPMAGFDGYVDEASTAERILRDVFDDGDRWFVTGDLLRRDVDGDYWFVDRLSDVVRTPYGPAFTREIEDTIYKLREVKMVAVYGARAPGGSERVLCAAVVPRGEGFDVERLAEHVRDKLEPHQRPVWVRLVDAIPMSDGYRPLKSALAEQGIEPGPRAFELSGSQYVGRDAPVVVAE